MRIQEGDTHAEMARWLLDRDDGEHGVALAQAHATLALAAEARTANLLTLLATEPRGGRRDRIEAAVLARLGLS